MMAAFTAVVVVQWLWIKYAIRERETKFTSQVYDVLNRVVNRIDEFNYLRYKQEMNEQIGEIKNYNDLIASQQGGTSSEWYSNNLFNILNNDINRLKGERSYLFSVVRMPVPESGRKWIRNLSSKRSGRWSYLSGIVRRGLPDWHNSVSRCKNF